MSNEHLAIVHKQSEAGANQCPAPQYTIAALTTPEQEQVEAHMDPLLIMGRTDVAFGMSLEVKTTLIQQCNANYDYLNEQGISVKQLATAVDLLQEGCRTSANEAEESLFYRPSQPGTAYVNPLTGEPTAGTGVFGIVRKHDALAITEVEAAMLRYGIFDCLDALDDWGTCRAQQIVDGLSRSPYGRDLLQAAGVPLDPRERTAQTMPVREMGGAMSIGLRREREQIGRRNNAVAALSQVINDLHRKARVAHPGQARDESFSAEFDDIPHKAGSPVVTQVAVEPDEGRVVYSAVCVRPGGAEPTIYTWNNSEGALPLARKGNEGWPVQADELQEILPLVQEQALRYQRSLRVSQRQGLGRRMIGLAKNR